MISLSDYKIDRLIKKANSPVHELIHLPTKNKFAIKLFFLFLNSEISEIDDIEDKVLKEFAFIKRFNDHPSFVKFHNISKEIDTSNKVIIYGIIMELMATSLDEEIQAKMNKLEFYPYQEVVKFIKQTYEGFLYMEKSGIAHRDIKPANILIDKDGNYKIGDFGVSKLISQETSVGQTLVGTPNYFSFELFECSIAEKNFKGNYFFSDACSYGLTLLKMLTLEKKVSDVVTYKNTQKFEELLKKVQKTYNLVQNHPLLEFLRRLLEKEPLKRQGFLYNKNYARALYLNQTNPKLKDEDKIKAIYEFLDNEKREGLLLGDQIKKILSNFASEDEKNFAELVDF